MRRGRALLAALLAGAALAAGCGDDDEPDTVTETETVTQEQPATGATTEREQPQGGKVDRAEAEEKAREESSRQLDSQPGGFSVPEDDWQVACSGGESGGAWDCLLSSGPCNATATVRRQPDGAVLTEAEAGCVAD